MAFSLSPAVEQDDLLEKEWQVLGAANDRIRRLSAAQACRMVPVLRPGKVIGAVYDRPPRTSM